MITKPSPAVVGLLKRIASGKPHRASWETYEAATKGGFAVYNSTLQPAPGVPAGWSLTEAGKLVAAPVTKVEVITDDFEFSHGRKPRGYGSWAFAFGARDAQPEFIPGSMTFTDARRKAVELAKVRGVSELWVCS